MKATFGGLAVLVMSLAANHLGGIGTATAEVPASLITPDKMETSIGTLEFKDGAPSVETAKKVYDTLAFTAALNAYNNSFRGASALALCKGFASVGAKDNNTIVVFSDLMDSNSLFLTPNSDTIYYLACLDLTKGPIVIEQPSGGLGTINEMWFSWIIDVGFPGPDRGKGSEHLFTDDIRLSRPYDGGKDGRGKIPWRATQ
jgi:hypothetical protein